MSGRRAGSTCGPRRQPRRRSRPGRGPGTPTRSSASTTSIAKFSATSGRGGVAELADGERRGASAGPRRAWRLHSMLSLEALTLPVTSARRRCSRPARRSCGAPIIDYQHPHDLFMWTRRRISCWLAGRVTLLAALRPWSDRRRSDRPRSCTGRRRRDNPQAPLAHHYMDSVAHHAGRDPRRHRGAARGAPRARGSTAASPTRTVSISTWGRSIRWPLRLALDPRSVVGAGVGARISRQTEGNDPVDRREEADGVGRLHDGRRAARRLLAARVRAEPGDHATRGPISSRCTIRSPAPPHDDVCACSSSAAKSILLTVGFHPVGVFHRHRQSQVSAVTCRLRARRADDHRRSGAFGIGGDVTGYAVPSNLSDVHGIPRVVPPVGTLPRAAGRQSTPCTRSARDRRLAGPSLDDDPPLEGRVELVRVVVEAARARDVRGPRSSRVWPGFRNPTSLMAGQSDVHLDGIRRHGVRPCVGVEERHPAADAARGLRSAPDRPR